MKAPLLLVILESPYAGPTKADIVRHIWYARVCIRDCLKRGESAYASHLLFTQPGILRDEVPHEREEGIVAGHAWIERSDYTVAYTDFGISKGMAAGIEAAKALNKRVEYRKISPSALKEIRNRK